MQVDILPSARIRLMEIWDYTAVTWGEKQADRYLKGLKDKLDEITVYPELWRSLRRKEFQDIYFVRYRHHYLFFRQLEKDVLGLISVLHENMEIPHRLKEDIR